MTGQVNKKRNIYLNGKWIKVDSKRITINTTRPAPNVPEIKGGKCKIGDVWYIFDLETGNVISQGNNWTDCLNTAKDMVRKLFPK
jgi:hypothetical protein